MHGGFNTMARTGRKRKYRGAASDIPFKVLHSVAEVEQRLLRACMTLRAVPDPDRRFQWIGTSWPEVLRSAEEAYGDNEEVMPKFRPTPSDVSDYLNALRWVRPLDWSEFRLIWWRSFDLSFGQMARRIHKTDETARRWYRDAILRAWHESNREETAGSGSIHSIAASA